MKPIVINFFGEPSSGKSTAATYVFSKLKMNGVNCEYVSEFAKDKVYDLADEPFKHQEYLFGKQSYRMGRVKDKVDVIVTDSPLLLSVIYNVNKEVLDDSFDEVVLKMFDSYNNKNYFLIRNHEYKNEGRLQDEEQSKVIKEKINYILDYHNIDYIKVLSCVSVYDKIINDIMEELKDEQ